MENTTNKKTLSKELKFDKVKELNKKYELDDVNDLWYFVKSSSSRWVAGSAH